MRRLIPVVLLLAACSAEDDPDNVFSGNYFFKVDGGVASPVPVGAARGLGELPIVAVNVNRVFEEPAVSHEPAALERDGPGTRERLAAFLDSDRLPSAAREFLAGVFGRGSEDPEPSAAGDASQGSSSSSSLLQRMGLFTTSDGPRRPGMVDSLYNSVVLLQHHLARSQFEAEPPALLVEPNMEGVGLFDYHLGTALVDEGERATRAALTAY